MGKRTTDKITTTVTAREAERVIDDFMRFGPLAFGYQPDPQVAELWAEYQHQIAELGTGIVGIGKRLALFGEFARARDRILGLPAWGQDTDWPGRGT